MNEHEAVRELLRKEKIKARNSLTPEQRSERSAAICRALLASEEYRRAKTVMLYKAVRGEVRLDLLEAENAAAPEKKRFAYPLCVGDGKMLAVAPGSTDVGGGAWRRGAFGIWEPDPARGALVPPEALDLVVCPCTAFDADGRRLGMGGGYYDRFLPLCVHAHILAVAFEAQRAECVPAEAWDVPMRRVITEESG